MSNKNPMLPTVRRYKPFVENVRVAKQIRNAVADRLSRQRVGKSEPDSVRLRIGQNGTSRAVEVRLPPDYPSMPATASTVTDFGDVFASLPRRAQLEEAESSTELLGLLPGDAAGRVRVSPFRILSRLLVWFGAGGAFMLGNAWDAIRRRDSIDRRAVRLRQIIERAGGTLIKIGQQMSIRLDILPVRYCEELSLMLDSVPPFPTDDAIAVIERTTGKRLEAIFSAFDPQPIGSGSIACVYQAVLRENGEKVAVKVRRPDIWKLFEGDFRVLEIFTSFAETLALVRPGYSVNFRTEFRKVFSSELDFRREARYQELFRRRAGKARRQFFTAPRVYAEYSNEEVLVMEFVSGMWLSEVLAGVERRDEISIARMKELNIEPVKLSKRLLYVHDWGMYDHIAFHADPHPANIVVRANSEMVFVDFGACGYLNRVRREMFMRVYDSFLAENTWPMAQLSLNASEPLPQMDINAVAADVESAYHHVMLSIKSKHSHWYERTSANMWITMFQIISKYGLSAPPDVLMYARSTLLYDTLAARLWPQVDFYKEYATFGKDQRKKIGKRARRAIRKRLHNGLTGNDFMALQEVASTSGDLLFRLQRLFAAPYDFAVASYAVEKWIHVVMTILRFGIRSALLTGVILALVVGAQVIGGQPADIGESLKQVLNATSYKVIIALLALVHLRIILFRLNDPIKQ